MKQSQKKIRIEFNNKILDRDQYRCRICGDGSSELSVHQITPVTELPRSEFVEDNYITLCSCCTSLVIKPTQIQKVFNASGEIYYDYGKGGGDLLDKGDLYDAINVNPDGLETMIALNEIIGRYKTCEY